MTSRRSQSSEETFTLFPFLAVLLCTMGTLTMIFVAVARKDADGPDAPASIAENAVEFDRELGLGEVSQYGTLIEAETSDDPDDQDDAYERALIATGARSYDDLVSEKESADWYADELRSIRERVENSFEENRARLAAAEASLARLRSELETTKRKYEALQEESVAQRGETAVALQDRINALDVDIELLRKEIEELREKNKDAKRSYAIVPYQGKKGTFRRPIYIECSASGVCLQPEGVRFDEADFLISKYPGNPFDSALRATARHYLETTGGKTASGEKIEAYPLLIVRPNGSKYFYEAVAALASWGDLYGYEFVGEDQKLEYPESDPTLKRLVSEQVDLARRRLALQLRQALNERRAMLSESGFSSRGGGGLGDGRGVSGTGSGGSELQSRLGSNVRIGAARPDVVEGFGSGGSSANFAAGGGANGRETLAIGVGGRDATSDAASIAGGSGLSDRYDPLGGTPRGTSPDGEEFDGSQPLSGDFAANSSGEASVQESNVARRTNRSFSPGAGADGTASIEGAGGAGDARNGSFASNAVGETAEGRNAAFGSQDGAQTQYVDNAAATGNAPRYIANFTDPAARTEDESTVDARQTLGNTSFAQRSDGTVGVGELSKSRPLDDEEPADYGTAASSVPDFMSSAQPEAIRLSQEKPAMSGIERAVLTRCEPGAIVFPKQPGVKKSTKIVCRGSESVEERERELLDAFTFCVKSWKLAGRNAYWAPYVKAEVIEGGEEQFRQLSAFCKRQGLSIVRVETGYPIK